MIRQWVVTLCIIITVPITVNAADFTFYGQARFASWYLNGRGWDAFHPDNYDPAPNTNPQKIGNNDNSLVWELMTTSRLGFKFAPSDDITGFVEYGAGGSNGVNLRHLAGSWLKDDFEITVGQTWTPTTLIYSEQAFGNDDILWSVGIPFAGRQPQIQFRYKGFKLAFIHIHNASDFGIEFETGPEDPATGAAPTASPDVDIYLPKIEAGFHYGKELFFVDLYGGYQRFKLQGDNIGVEPGFAPPPNLDVDAWLAGVGAGVNLGQGYFKANVFKALNGGAYGLTNENLTDTAFKNPLYIPQFEPNKLLDNETLGYALILGWKFNDRLRMEAGYGHTEREHDASSYVPSGFIGKDERDAYYIQFPITIASTFFIIPEFGYYDFNDDQLGRDEGSFTYFGAKWQINF
jgi:hypothetical protein